MWVNVSHGEGPVVVIWTETSVPTSHFLVLLQSINHVSVSGITE